MADKKTAERKNVTTIDEAKEGIRGKITMEEDVVATIAGLAARDIKGIHSLGKSRLIRLAAMIPPGESTLKWDRSRRPSISTSW